MQLNSARRQIAGVYLLALAAFALALWFELLLARVEAGRFSFMGFSLAAAVSAWLGGYIPALVVILLSALASDYFLFEPGSFFSFENQGQALALLGFTAGWTLVAMLVRRVFEQISAEHAERRRAERSAGQSDRIAQLTAAFGQARTSAAVIEAAVQESLYWLRADAAMFLLIDAAGQSATVARAIGDHSGGDPEGQVISLGVNSPLSEAVTRAAPVIIDSVEARHPDFVDVSSDPFWSEAESTIVLPVAIDRRVVAVIRVDFRETCRLDAADHEFLSVVRSRAAQALDRAWQQESAHRARMDAESLRARADVELAERQKTEQALRASETRYRALATRTTRLHSLTAGLSEAVTVSAVGKAIVQQGKVVVGAAAGELMLLVENGAQFETVYGDHHDAETNHPHRIAAEPGLCATDAVQSRRPLFIGTFSEWQDKYWLSASFAADGGYASAAALPLIVEGAAIGALVFHFSVPVNFDDEYQALLISVAQHCTQALDRARLYEGAQHARAEAEAANRLKDDFVSIVSHELRTPLNAILGWASMLQSRSLQKDVVPRALESIYQNASRQAKLVDDLLDFSRITAGRVQLDFEKIDAARLLRGIIESVVPLAAAKHISLGLDEIPPATLRGDVKRLEQVFVNLLSNALKFTGSGGAIMVGARLVDRTLEIRVTDNGMGIDAEFLPHVFDRFRQGDSTTTRDHGGLGLGLSIAKQLVEAHNGTITVESAGKDQGTTFVVSLPVVGQQPERPAEPDRILPAPRAKPRLDGVRVLIVDDEPDAREVIGHALEECGASITMATSATDAFDILEHQEIDVLLADVAMPDEDGYSLIRRIRASGTRLGSLPAAAVTAHAREDERREALAAGFQVHVAKPIEPFELARTVDQLARSAGP